MNLLPVDRLDTALRSLGNGARVAVDTTLVSRLSSGKPRRHAGRVDGAALRKARRRKERTYPELLWSQRRSLVVLAIEVGAGGAHSGGTGSSARQAGAVLEQAARRKRELLTARRLVVFGIEVGGRWNGEAGFAPRPRPCQSEGAASMAACLSVAGRSPALVRLCFRCGTAGPSLACLARARLP